VDSLQCGRCNAARDTRDNFCRACGHQFTVNLPVVRESRLPTTRTTRGGIPTPLVGSMALLAVGTGLEWLARRMAGSAARAAGRALIGADRPQTPVVRPSAARGVVVDEVVYVRKIEVRR
jgi:hypothetical protein